MKKEIYTVVIWLNDDTTLEINNKGIIWQEADKEINKEKLKKDFYKFVENINWSK